MFKNQVSIFYYSTDIRLLCQIAINFSKRLLSILVLNTLQTGYKQQTSTSYVAHGLGSVALRDIQCSKCPLPPCLERTES